MPKNMQSNMAIVSVLLRQEYMPSVIINVIRLMVKKEEGTWAKLLHESVYKNAQVKNIARSVASNLRLSISPKRNKKMRH